MKRQLPNYWYLSQIYFSLFALLLGLDAGDIPMDASLNFETLVAIFKPDASHTRLFCPDALHILTACFVRSVDSSHGNVRRSRKDDFLLERTNKRTSSLAKQPAAIAPETEDITHAPVATPGDRPASASLSVIPDLMQLQAVQSSIVQFVSELYGKCPDLAETLLKGDIVDEMAGIIFPALSQTYTITAPRVLVYANSKDVLPEKDTAGSFETLAKASSSQM